jgi:uncharacterized protein
MQPHPGAPQITKSVILSEHNLIGKQSPMKLHLNTQANKNIFTAHGADYVMVNGRKFEHSIVVTPEQILSDWQPQGFEGLTEHHFTHLLTIKPEIVLLGTGTQQLFPHPSLYQELTKSGIGVDSMSTPAACRTYNILMGEDRKVLVAILL